VPHWPIGLFYQATAYRSSLDGVLNGIALSLRNGWSVPRPAELIARDLVPGATDGRFERSGAPSPRQAEIR